MMKLIAYGKVLDDDSKQIKEFNLKDGDQIVVMISKVLPFINDYRPSPSLKSKLRTRRIKRK